MLKLIFFLTTSPLLVRFAGLSDQTNFARKSFGNRNIGEPLISFVLLKDRFTVIGPKSQGSELSHSTCFHCPVIVPLS